MNHPLSSSQTVVDARIETLELKLMHLENTVQELHEVILRQYRDIERLQLQQLELKNRTHGTAESTATPPVHDELPPHY
jgi:uncharacterized coiled-coil protein SlyX